MMPNQNLVTQFNKFAGREVAVTETIHHHKRYGDMTSVQVNDGDMAVAELGKAVEDAGLRLRLWLPGTVGTMDLRGDRLNAYVEKEADGKYRIQNKFKIG